LWNYVPVVAVVVPDLTGLEVNLVVVVAVVPVV
jgi:hypothetical protein